MSVNIRVDRGSSFLACIITTDDGVTRTASGSLSDILDEIECFLTGEFPPDLGIRVTDGLSTVDRVM